MGFDRKEYDVAIQDQDSPPFQYYLMREDKTDITLTSAVTPGDTVISVSAGHGFVGGEYVVIMENDLIIQTEVISVATNDLTLQVAVPYGYTTGATVIRGVIDMNVDGSSPVDFIYNPRQCEIPIDIQYVHITIWNASLAGDDGKFGDLTALTNGLRFIKENNLDQGLGNFTTNSDFREFGANVNYNDKAGAGTYGVAVDFNLKDSYGVIIRIDPRTTDVIKAIVRDNLSTLNRFRVSIMGQYTLGE